MKPPKREDMQFEKLKTDDFIIGEISDVQYEETHTFMKGTQYEKQGPAVRFKFKMDGYQHPHYSRWGYFSYGEKSNLYLKYLVPLVEGATPDMDFDLDQLKNLRVRTLWQEKNNFQSIEVIRPVEGKILAPQAPGVAEAKETTEKIKDAMAKEMNQPEVGIGLAETAEVAEDVKLDESEVPF